MPHLYGGHGATQQDLAVQGTTINLCWIGFKALMNTPTA